MRDGRVHRGWRAESAARRVAPGRATVSARGGKGPGAVSAGVDDEVRPAEPCRYDLSVRNIARGCVEVRDVEREPVRPLGYSLLRLGTPGPIRYSAQIRNEER